MISISNDFKNSMKRPMKELDAYIITSSGDIRSADDLISFKISCDTDMCKTAMRKLEAKILGDHNVLGEWVNVGFGVRLENNTFEYLDYGAFKITEISTNLDSGITELIGYDKMLDTMVEYTPLEITYPINLLNYTRILCTECGLELGNEFFGKSDLPADYNPMNEWLINEDLWENINGITYRDIFVQIAQATGSTCMIGADNKIYFKPITETSEELTYNEMKKLKLEPIYGEINSVVLGRDPVVGEDVFMKDDVSIEANGLTEYRIDNNEIVDKDRESAITPIFNSLKGISYYPFEITTTGLGWYEVGDSFNVVNDVGNRYNCTLFNYSITIDGAMKETLKTNALTKTESQYQYANTITKRIKNTEIIVNKQEQYINQLVSDMYEEDGIINEKFTNVYQDIENVITSVQNSGGANLIKNSVMFSYDSDRNPTEWTVEGEGTLKIEPSSEAMSNGSLSGHTFVLNDKKVKQRVYVKSNNHSDSTYYTFSTKIKKNATGYCYVKIYNNNEEYIINVPAGDSPFYQDYDLQALLPRDNYYDIEFYGSADSDATFTDNMFNIGEYKTQWTQASGEIMNTQVNINLNGVLVKSSVYEGDYTVMSPLEFAGYSNVNGVTTKVFTINKDTTEVEKLKAKKGISMAPIKIVPINDGTLIGWAFVPTTEV